MIQSILDEIWAFVVTKLEGLFGLLHIGFDPGTLDLWKWYFFGFIFLIIVMIIGYFFNFTWVRATLGVALLLVGAFIAGGRQMHGEMNAEIAKSKVKPKPIAHVAPAEQPSIFSNWFN